MEFLQSLSSKWRELKKFVMYKTDTTPTDVVEGGIWYNTTDDHIHVKTEDEVKTVAYEGDIKQYAGVVIQPTITTNANVITIGNDGVMRVYDNANYEGLVQEFTPVGKSLTIPASSDVFLCYSIADGYHLRDSLSYTINFSDIITVQRYIYEFGILHTSEQDNLALGQSEKQLMRTAVTEFYARVGTSGITLSIATLTANIAGGKIYNGPVLQNLAAFTSSTDTFSRHVLTGSTWSRTAMTTINTAIYNPSTGEAALPVNKWAWCFVYRTVGNEKEAILRYGDQYFNDKTKALEGIKLPSSVSFTIRAHTVLVGYFCYKYGDTSIPTENIYSAWDQLAVSGGGVSEHNALSSIDGGDPAIPYYGHNTQSMQARQTNAGSANGYALLGADGKLPSNQLPSYVDDVLEYTNKAAFPATGESGKIYVDLTTNLTWRWSGSVYVEISPSLALGITSSTAGRGDWTKTAYDHSQITNANPHGTIASQIQLTPVGGIASTNVQGAFAELDSEKLSISSAATEYVSKTTTTSQSISSELVTKKSIYNHRTAGTGGVSGHFKVCTLTLTNAYINRPLEFTLTQHSKKDSAKVSLLFNNDGEFNPSIAAFTYNSLSTYGIYAYRSATSVWEIYATKSESYDDLEVSEFHDAYGRFPNIVWETTQVAAVPSGSIQATLAEFINDTTGNAATATKLATARNIALTGDVTGNANFDGSGNINITATVADDSHNHVVSNIDNLQGYLDNKVNHYSVGYNVASLGYYWCNIGSVYLETGKYNSILLDYNASFYGNQHWSYGLIFIQLNTGSTYPTIKLTKINTNSNVTSLVSLYGDWNATNGILTLWGAFGGGNSGGNIQCNLLSRSVPTATFGAYGGWQSAAPTWRYQITATKQELTNVAPLDHDHVWADLTDVSPAEVGPASYDASAAHFGHNSFQSGMAQTSAGSVTIGAESGQTTSIFTGSTRRLQINPAGDMVFEAVTGSDSRSIVFGMGTNDYARIRAGATADNAGFFEIATGDDSSEPIIVRQYSEAFTTITRTAQLLDGAGNTSFPGNVSITAPATSDDSNKAVSSAWVKDVAALASHTHGNITNAGAIGTTSGLPVVTTTSGVLTATAWSTTNPNMDGTASVGTSTVPSRSDHRHPSDTSRLAIGAGLSAGASVVIQSYTAGRSDNNAIYMCY